MDKRTEVEVSEEFFKEYDLLINQEDTLFEALTSIFRYGDEKYPSMLEFLFYNTAAARNDRNQLIFAEVWSGKSEYVVKEKLYYVQFIKSDRYSYLVYNTNENEYFTENTSIEGGNFKMKFTEKEIKNINPAFFNKDFLLEVE